MSVTVGIDATPLLGPRTGVGVFVDGLIAALAGRPGLSLRAYGLTARGSRRLGVVLPAGVAHRRLPLPAGAAMRAWAVGNVPTIEAWSGRVDVVHGTNFVVPPSRRAARLVTVHDLTSLHFPQLCTPAARRYPDLVRRAVSQGAWIHAVSESVATEAVEHLGADPRRVRVIYSGVRQPPLWTSAVGAVGAAGPRSASRPYILALGTVEPRKDLPALVAAFDQIADDDADLELHIAGPPGWGEGALRRAIDAARHARRIVRLGWVPDPVEELRAAAVVAYPSLYEGFGFPPLEAMASGVPVVATAVAALPEVLGDAAVLVAPGDVDALASALARVRDDDALRARLIEAGHTRVMRYRWEVTGDSFARLYAELAAARRS
ncbi:MAG: glycosyltransferase family 4 protein [Actinomycetota bacterium]|nr:glycosyltransferase family 4 protein [Actinomycetota bacterium]